MGKNLMSMIWNDISRGDDAVGGMSYRSQILLKELWADHCCLDIVFDLGLTRKASQRGWQSLLDMLGYYWGE